MTTSRPVEAAEEGRAQLRGGRRRWRRRAQVEKARAKTGPELMAEVLEAAARPLHQQLIAERVIALDCKRKPKDRSYRGKTPDETIRATLARAHAKGGFAERVAPGIFALRDWPRSKKSKIPELPGRWRRISPWA